jgi:8-oxo-dGTP diphosphatase
MLLRGERPTAAALREVEEETGLRCEVVGRLPDVQYVLPDGRLKRVKWWSMNVIGHGRRDLGSELNAEVATALDGETALEGETELDIEVDEVRWISVESLDSLLTYPDDVAVVAAMMSASSSG